MRADERLPYLDFIRAAAATYIVGFWHLMNYTGGYAPGYANAVTVRLTVLALGSFFFVSGFLLGKGLPPKNVRDVLAFYKRRLLRIYPLFLFAIALYLITKSARPADLLAAAFLTSAFLSGHLTTLWFVGVLLCFYLMTPALMYFASGSLHFLSVAVFFACAMAALQAISPDPDPRLLLYFPSFSLGVYFANRTLDEGRLALVSAFCLLALELSLSGDQPVEKDLLSLPFAALLPLALVAICERISILRKPPPLVLTVSHASFVMYLLHRPIYKELAHLAPHGLGRLLLLFGVGFPLVVLVSSRTQSFYDRLLANKPTKAVTPDGRPVS
ncbi:acyltransferase family protein [Hyphomicrobium sp.]|jgi:peptidoglycan/LPS O-acetylase OafA/YrhL|uniref:acyltransferase family protein n=1 Tax=Hyphomicrobium sp. TaxID=82 RepID=UPI0035666CC4